MFDNIATSIQHIREGKLRPLAVTTTEPSELLPGVPAVANYLPGYEASGWYGLGAPKGGAAEIIDKLHNEIAAALADPKMKVRLADLSRSLQVCLPISGSSWWTKLKNGARS